MPKVPDLPLGLRFFARVEAFVCECPRCGHLLMGRSVATKRRGKGVDRTYRREVWNPVAGRAWCGYCHRHYVVGLLLYPAAMHTVGKVLIGERRPPDWKPTWQQLCAMRQEAGGYFVDEAKGPRNMVFLTFNPSMESAVTVTRDEDEEVPF